MHSLHLSRILTAVALTAFFVPAAHSAPHNIHFRDGAGEEIRIENRWFGSKKRVVKDRMGNKYESRKGLLGSTQMETSIMGNTIKRKKGVFGATDIEGSTIFGDRVSTKRGLFGRRTTTVDVSGSAALLKGLFGTKQNVQKSLPVNDSPVDAQLFGPQ